MRARALERPSANWRSWREAAVNPTVYTAAEFSKRARTENAFVTRVLEQPKLWVIGSEHELPLAA